MFPTIHERKTNTWWTCLGTFWSITTFATTEKYKISQGDLSQKFGSVNAFSECAPIGSNEFKWNSLCHGIFSSAKRSGYGNFHGKSWGILELPSKAAMSQPPRCPEIAKPCSGDVYPILSSHMPPSCSICVSQLQLAWGELQGGIGVAGMAGMVGAWQGLRMEFSGNLSIKI